MQRRRPENPGDKVSKGETAFNRANRGLNGMPRVQTNQKSVKEKRGSEKERDEKRTGKDNKEA